MNYTLRVLRSFERNLEYEALYKFWLGVDSADSADHQKLKASYKKQENFRKKLSTQFDSRAFPTFMELKVEIEKN